jgi:hypothetical protein
MLAGDAAAVKRQQLFRALRSIWAAAVAFFRPPG